MKFLDMFVKHDFKIVCYYTKINIKLLCLSIAKEFFIDYKICVLKKKIIELKLQLH